MQKLSRDNFPLSKENFGIVKREFRNRQKRIKIWHMTYDRRKRLQAATRRAAETKDDGRHQSTERAGASAMATVHLRVVIVLKSDINKIKVKEYGTASEEPLYGMGERMD